MRKLSTVRVISNLSSIDGADNIEVATVDGWKVVVRKGQFKEGDLCIYFEIDSFLPASDERFSFLEKNFRDWNGKRGARVKTIKLRGQISQGVCLPISMFPEAHTLGVENHLDEALGVEKWEPAEIINRFGNAAGVFPWFIPKTDQERIQNRTEVLSDKNTEYQVTIKLDGCSMTVFAITRESPYFNEMKEKDEFNLHEDVVFGVCSRNILLKNDNNCFTKCAIDCGILNNMLEYALLTGDSFAVQGELVSPSIQGNHEKVDKTEFYVYNIFSIDSQEYVTPQTCWQVTQDMNLKHVPVLENSWSIPNNWTIEDMLNYAEGQGMNEGVMREGLVFKNKAFSADSFKVISNSYLLKTGK